MKNIVSGIMMSFLVLFLHSCTKQGLSGDAKDGVAFTSGSSTGIPGSGGPSGGGGNNPGGTAGVVTAGEWNDIDHWDFWTTLLRRDTIKTFPGIWGFNTKNKVSVLLKDAGNKLIHDAIIKLNSNGLVSTCRTDNFGKAELFSGLYDTNSILHNYTLTAEYNGQSFSLGAYPASQTSVTASLPLTKTVNSTLDIMFVVDATGSMGDEISYLKNELGDVINRAGSQLSGTQIRMGSVFYRDVSDDYLTRPFDFSTNTSQLINFLNNQSAAGGNDFPEAVDEGLKAAIQGQQWSTNAVNRLIFLILDAPSHKTPEVMNRLKEAVTQAQQKGIHIIPVSASGIDWETEFELRFLAISTSSTYVFITNDSGIGNPHFTPTVGTYQVEYLNNLMVRLITKYGQNRD